MTTMVTEQVSAQFSQYCTSLTVMRGNISNLNKIWCVDFKVHRGVLTTMYAPPVILQKWVHINSK